MPEHVVDSNIIMIMMMTVIITMIDHDDDDNAAAALAPARKPLALLPISSPASKSCKRPFTFH